MYHFCYSLMLIGFAGVACQAPTIKMKIVGGLLFIVNSIIFWR